MANKQLTFVETLTTRKLANGDFQRIIRLSCPIHGMVGVSITARTMQELNARTPDGDKIPYFCPMCSPEKVS